MPCGCALWHDARPWVGARFSCLRPVSRLHPFRLKAGKDRSDQPPRSIPHPQAPFVRAPRPGRINHLHRQPYSSSRLRAKHSPPSPALKPTSTGWHASSRRRRQRRHPGEHRGARVDRNALREDHRRRPRQPRQACGLHHARKRRHGRRRRRHHGRLASDESALRNRRPFHPRRRPDSTMTATETHSGLADHPPAPRPHWCGGIRKTTVAALLSEESARNCSSAPAIEVQSTQVAPLCPPGGTTRVQPPNRHGPLCLSCSADSLTEGPLSRPTVTGEFSLPDWLNINPRTQALEHARERQLTPQLLRRVESQ